MITNKQRNLNASFFNGASRKVEVFAEINLYLSEPDICKHFGCGKMLTLEEKRFGDLCVHHKEDKRNEQRNKYLNLYL